MKYKRIPRTAGIPAAVLAALLLAVGVAGTPAHAQGAESALLRRMVGTWDVEQWMWTGPDAEPIAPGAAVARRRLVGEFVEETMEAAPGSGQQPFTRIAYLGFNEVRKRFEWASLDTRAPQLMFETAFGGIDADSASRVWVQLDHFVLPSGARPRTSPSSRAA